MTSSPKVPVLHPGDTLTRDEFERRYSAMPHVKKAELIEGVVYMPSPVRHTFHGRPHGLLAGWLRDYVRATPGIELSIDASVRLASHDEPQPDLLLFVEPPKGTSRIDADGYITGPPELAIEVAASSVSYDLHQKLHAYRRAGVSEYLVLRSEDTAVDWFVLRSGTYQRLPADPRGILQSEVFPGLWLSSQALLLGDDSGMNSVLRAGLQTPEHAAFCARLAS